MLDDGRAEHFEEEVLVGLFFLPPFACFLFGFRACADRDQDHAVGFRLPQRALQTFAGKRNSVNLNRIVRNFERLRLTRIDPGAPVLGVPTARPIGQLLSPAFEHPAARIAQQPRVLGGLDAQIGQRAGQFDHAATRHMESAPPA